MNQATTKTNTRSVWFYQNPNKLCVNGNQTRLKMQEAIANAAGMHLVQEPTAADCAVVVACADRGPIEIDAQICHAKELMGGGSVDVVLAGCAASIKPQFRVLSYFYEIPGVNLTFATQQDSESRTDALLRTIGHDTSKSISDFTIDTHNYHHGLDTQPLRIQHNCHNNCWYCMRAGILGQAPITEAPLEQVKSAIDELKQRGVRNLQIGGTNTSLYTHLVELLQYTQDLGFFDSVELMNCAPQNLTPDKIAALNLPVVSHVNITCDVTDPKLSPTMRHISNERMESIYSAIDPSKLISSNLITNLPGETIGDEFYKQTHQFLLQNRLYTQSVSSYMPPATIMFEKRDDTPESYIRGQYEQAVSAAESVNQNIIESYQDKIMTLRVNKITTDENGTKIAIMNMFGYDFAVVTLVEQESLESELQIGDVVDVRISGRYPGGNTETLVDKGNSPPYGAARINEVAKFTLSDIRRSTRRPSYKKYDSYEELLADVQTETLPDD